MASSPGGSSGREGWDVSSLSSPTISSRSSAAGTSSSEDKEIPRYKTTADVQIIDLDEEVCSTALKENDPSTTDACYKIVEAVISERQKVWHYIDPSGNEQGPFALASLRYWKEKGFFDDDFRVWRTGQSKEDAILLIDVLR